MNEYIEKLNKKEIFESMKEYATIHNVPIIEHESIIFLKHFIKMNNILDILELGTAICYSANHMAKVCDSVDTIERNEIMYNEAIKNKALYDKDDKIKIYLADALLIDNSELKEQYDMIFIDAAKAQYLNFFNKYEPLLKVGGYFVSDNILFHGAVEGTIELSKNVRNMVKKIDDFNNSIRNNENYETFFLSIGDGLAISKKVK